MGLSLALLISVLSLFLLVDAHIDANDPDYYFLETSICEELSEEGRCQRKNGCTWCSTDDVGACVEEADVGSLSAGTFSCSNGNEDIDDALVGEWTMQNALEDSIIELFGTGVLLLISRKGKHYRVNQRFGSGETAVWQNFTVPVELDQCQRAQRMGTRVFAENPLEGIRFLDDARLSACNVGAIASNALQVEIEVPVHVSTGNRLLKKSITYAPVAGKLMVLEQRSSREGFEAWTYARTNAELAPSREAPLAPVTAAPASGTPLKSKHKQYTMTFDDDWTLDGGGPAKILLISLQAAANAEEPVLYFDYGPNWDFTYCADIKAYYEDSRGMELTILSSLADALAALPVATDYIVYDPDVRESIMVAMTLAGVYKALIVAPNLVDSLPDGMKMVYDLRNKFTGYTPAETYTWAWREFKDKTSRKTVIWMGGECNNVMKPGVADYGIRMNAFFTDLNTRPLDDPLSTPAEYYLADEIMRAQEKYSLVQGWHSYCKDMERTFVSLSSSHSLRVEGLHTIPNLSFNSLVPISEGFEFKNNHNVQPDGPLPVPEDKVYLAAVQTDSLGLGAWVEPGRGAIPYAWECTLNFLWLQPAVLEYYYRTATKNDYFIGALSGPGYMYPKAIPPEDLPEILALANQFVDALDLRVFETMDYSQGSTVVGNTDLTRQVVDTYYRNMPNIMGFINGYSPSFTFDSRDGRPFVSFDYYLAPPPSAGSRGGGTTDEAIADLVELANLNKKDGKPYFLLMHVREWSNVTRVQQIMERLPSNFETVALDIFLSMAGQEPTFETHFCPPEHVQV